MEIYGVIDVSPHKVKKEQSQQGLLSPISHIGNRLILEKKEEKLSQEDISTRIKKEEIKLSSTAAQARMS